MTSTNFTFNNTVYTANDKMTYFYRWPEGRKGERVRIKKADFESAYSQFVESDKLDHKAAFERDLKDFGFEESEFTNIDPLLKAAEDPTISVEEFCDMITEEDIERDARELEAYIAKTEESETTEEIKEIQKKMKKTRKSKDIAYTYSENGETVVTLTAKQVDFVKHLPDTTFWENGLDSTPWVDVLCDDIKGQFAGKPMTVGAMVSTLCEKGLMIRGKMKVNGRKATYIGLTDLGKTMFATGWGLE